MDDAVNWANLPMTLRVWTAPPQDVTTGNWVALSEFAQAHSLRWRTGQKVQ